MFAGRFWRAVPLVLSAALALASAHQLSAAEIEAVKGKRYRLDKRHGPWMIVVASFKQPPPERRTRGLTPEQAADELVYELRKNYNIPAYTFSQSTLLDDVPAADRAGQLRSGRIRAQEGSVVVLAGNYQSIDPESSLGKTAVRTLDFIKDLQPELLSEVDPSAPREVSPGGNPLLGSLRRLKNGGVWRATEGHPLPLSGAFFTLNPMLSPEEAAARRRDPLLRKLNPDVPLSLLNNPGRYSLVVATFTGRATNSRDKAEKWEDDHLDEAGLDAWQLTQRLRQQKIEAWVFHDRYRSVVTVGSFDAPGDPLIPQVQQTYGAKFRRNPLNGQDVLVAEVMTLPDPKNPAGPPLETWLFDPSPRLMEVPRLP